MDISSIGLDTNFNTAMTSMYKEKAESDSFQARLEQASKNGEDSKLREACNEFESYFLKMMFKSMRSTVINTNGLFKKSNAENIFQDMLDEQYCENAANGGNGIGLSDMLYRQLKNKNIKGEDL
jgi:flagellar protein FlgJ